MTASTLIDTPAELIHTYSNSSDIINEFQNEWKEHIVYGVNAACIEDKFPSDRFDVVLFNHPHLGGGTLLQSEEKHARKHYVLLAHYFHSAKKVLKENGVIHVCLCGSQPQTWDVIGAAKINGLYSVIEKSTDCPIDSWLFRESIELKLANTEDHYRIKRKFRNGKLGSKHFLSRYGYMHRRTEGELFRGNVKEVNVQRSINFVFASMPTDTSVEECSTDLLCRICHTQFINREDLSRHLENPALPDVQTDPVRNEPDAQRDQTPDNSTKCNIEQHESQLSFQPIDLKNANILVETTVTDEFDATRIKWLCRQPGFALSKCIKSKKQCEVAVKEGRIFVNCQVAFDTGRIVHENDVIALVEKYKPADHVTPCETDLAFGVKIIQIINNDDTDIPSLVVTYKPVGVRCAGQFSADTLEMITQSHFERRFSSGAVRCKSLSKVDTGCAGLCVLSIGTSNVDNVQVVYSYTALVHGVPDTSWKAGIYITVPKNGNRNWKRRATSNDKHKAIQTPTRSKLNLSNALFIQCEDSYAIKDDDSVQNIISTLTIQSSHDDGRLANTISFTLRKLGFPVVNDRFAKHESSVLPRRMKNLLKQKVCIGCYRVEIVDKQTRQNHIVSIDPHNRTKCKFWEKQLCASDNDCCNPRPC